MSIGLDTNRGRLKVAYALYPQGSQVPMNLEALACSPKRGQALALAQKLRS